MFLDEEGDHWPERRGEHGISDPNADYADPRSEAGNVTEKKVARQNDHICEEDPRRVETDDINDKTENRRWRIIEEKMISKSLPNGADIM